MVSIPENSISIGILGRPHGVRGQIKCHPETYDLSRIKLLKNVFVQTTKESYALCLESAQIAANSWILKFNGLDSRESVEPLVNGELRITAEERLEPPENRFFISDFPGYQAEIENGIQVGEITECIELPSVFAFHIRFSAQAKTVFPELAVKDVLAPWVDECVLHVDTVSKTVRFSETFLLSLCVGETCE